MDRSRNRHFLSSGGGGTRTMFGIQQKLKLLQQKSSNTPSPQHVQSYEQQDSDNNNEHDKMNGTNNNGEVDGKSELEYGNGEEVAYQNGGGEEEEEEMEETQDDGDGVGQEDQNYEEEEDDDYQQQMQQFQQQQQQLMLMGNGNGVSVGNGDEDDDGEVDGEEQTFEEEQEEDEYDYPDISEFVQTEFDGGCDDEEDDEEGRGLPQVRALPQPGFYDPQVEEEDDTTASLLQSLPPGTFIQQTKRSPTNASPTSTSARTSTTLNNLLLLRNNTGNSRKSISQVNQALSNALFLMEQQQQMENENEADEQYYGSNGVPLALIVQQQQQQQQQQSQGKRQAMNKPRAFKSHHQALTTSALLEQLQSPAYAKPNILSRKLNERSVGGQNIGNTYTQQRPPPRLQPRPNGSQRLIPHQQPQQQISLESLLRKASNSSKPMPRLQTLTAKQSSQNYIVDGRKLSFKTGQPQQKSPTRSLESLMLSHQKTSQLQQQLASGKMRGDGIMVGNLHIRQVSQPVIRGGNGSSLLRGNAGQVSQQPKNVPRCHVCRKTFATNQVLQRHVASVHGIVFGDVDVGKISSGMQLQQQLQKGMDGVNGNGGAQGQHRCRVCYRTFGSLESLRAHALNHEGEFKCRACRRGFPSWEILEQHEATHKKYECRWCEKYFMNSGNLKAHERIHTGERPYKCADCPKGFKQLGGLQYHLKTNPTHRPQKYKLEDQDSSSSQTQQQQNSPHDYSTSSNQLFNADMYGEDGSGGDGEDSYIAEEDDQEGGYLDLATSAM